MIYQYRTGGAGLYIPGLQVIQPMAGVAAAPPWWLSGSIDPSKIVAAYQPKGAANLAASYSNLANPGVNDAAPGVAPTWDVATGWTGNGTSTYLTTGITPTSAYSVIVRFSGATGTSRYLFGAYKVAGTVVIGINPDNGAGSRVYWNGTGAATVAGGKASGVMAVAGSGCYLDGASDATTTGAADTALELYIFTLNQGGAPGAFYQACNILAMAVYNATLSGGEVAALTTAMAAL